VKEQKDTNAYKYRLCHMTYVVCVWWRPEKQELSKRILYLAGNGVIGRIIT